MNKRQVPRSDPRSRFRPEPRAGIVLGTREKALLADVFLHRVMSRSQILALHFGSVARCNARLRQLFDWGFLSRAYLPTAPFGSEALYSIGKAAIPLLAAQWAEAGLTLEEEDIRLQCRRPVLSLLEHALAIGDVYIAVQKAVAAAFHIQIEQWLPEHFCRQEYEIRLASEASPSGGGRWRKEVFKPDAFLRLTRDAAPAARNYFLEVDRGHTNSRQFAGKLRTHARFLASGLFGDVFGWDRFQTLVVTTGWNRADNLRALAERDANGLFWFTTFKAVETSGILAPIWRAPFTADALELI